MFQTLTLEVEFKNPLNEKLWNCSLTVIGCGLFKSDYVERSACGHHYLNLTRICKVLHFLDFVVTFS